MIPILERDESTKSLISTWKHLPEWKEQGCGSAVYEGEAEQESEQGLEEEGHEKEEREVDCGPQARHVRRRRRCLSVGQHVTFDESYNLEHADPFRCSLKECALTWYTNEDFQRFRSATEVLVKVIVLGETRKKQCNNSSYLEVLGNIYHACCDMEYEINAITSVAEVVLSEVEEEELNRLYAQAGGNWRVGLETRVAADIGRDLVRKRRLLLETIWILQNKSRNKNEQEDDVFDLAHEIHRCSTWTSRPARLFAQLLAQAQLFADD